MKPNWNRTTRVGLVFCMAALGIQPAALLGQTTSQQAAGSAGGQKSGATSKRTTQKAAAHTSQRHSSHRPVALHGSSKRHRSAAARRRRAQLRPEPERIQEIQQALARAGYFNGQPDGRWNDQTRDAMRRFQADHGFPATGLPEAKSLMKLGLGPHSLPADLDAGSAARASTDTASGSPATPGAQQNPP